MNYVKVFYFLFIFSLFFLYLFLNVYFLESYNFIFAKSDIINYLNEYYTGVYRIHHIVFYLLFAVTNFFTANPYMSVIVLNVLVYFIITQVLVFEFNDRDYLRGLYFILSSYLTGFFLVVNIFSQYIAFLVFLFALIIYKRNSNHLNMKVIIMLLMSVLIHYSAILPTLFFILTASSREEYFKHSNIYIILLIAYIFLLGFAGVRYSIFSKYNNDEYENNIVMNLITLNPIITAKFILIGVRTLFDFYRKNATNSDIDRLKIYIFISFLFVSFTSHLGRLLIYVYPFIFQIVMEHGYEQRIEGIGTEKRKLKIPMRDIVFSFIYFSILHFLFFADVKADLVRHFLKRTS